MATDIPRYKLNDGNSLPVVGFGTYPLRGDEALRRWCLHWRAATSCWTQQ
jgi:diketogulonate reductase-like aldo/keto reductase